MSLYLANIIGDAAVHTVGFVFVLVVLGILWGITAGIGRFFVGRERSAAAVPSDVSTDEASVGEPIAAQTNEDEIAVVTAAVAMLVDERHRIVSIRASNLDWGREGRRQIFASHKIR